MAKTQAQINEAGKLESKRVARARAAALGTPRSNTVRARIVRATIG